MPPLPGPATSRRTAIAGAVTVLLAGGCEAGAPGPAPGRRAPTSGADPDADLLDRAVAEIDALLATVTGAVSGRPVLDRRLEAFATLHRAHREQLADGEPTAAATPATGRPAAVLRSVLAREEQGRQRLADWAVAAESGALARLLASMSAGIAVHLRAAGGPA